jgi:prolyl oligopeptidase
MVTQTFAQTPPETRQQPVSDDYHGITVTDPYRWLEQDVRESEQVADWVQQQNAVTFAHLDSIEQRQRIRDRMQRLWDYERVSMPMRAGKAYAFFRNDGLQNQSVLYWQRSLAEQPRVLIDPNTWSEDGTLALSGTAFSPDGRYLAYGIQDSGSDWRTWRIMEVDTGRVLDDELVWLKFTQLAWTPDSQGFFYSRYPAPSEDARFTSLNTDQKVYYHRLGTAQADDTLVHARPDQPSWGFTPEVTEDGRFLVITVWKGTDARYRVLLRDLNDSYAMPVALVPNFEHEFELLGNDGDVLYFRTDHQAPRGRVVAIDRQQPEPEHWREVVPQTEATLRQASLVGNVVVAQYLKDARSQVLLFSLAGEQLREVALPGVGVARGFAGQRGQPETFYEFSSFNQPPTQYRLDIATGESRLFRDTDLDVNAEDYVVEQVFYRSKDGTRVPMFIAHRADIQANGERPVLLYGYGGFNIPLTPGFDPRWLAWMDMGGVYAMPNLRGGGEYGAEWHKAGTRTQKQNVFDDFIAAAEYLVESGWTQPSRIGIHGRSNGGLLVGAVMAQRPGLFGAALPAVGVMDMLRFNQFTAGRFWVDDYGSPQNEEEFQALYAYSPYHNLRDGVAYPATLVTTADTDDRVVPGHSFKFAARLQQAHVGADPVLIRIETGAGHGAGTATSKRINEYADNWSFLLEHLGLELPEDY